MAKPKVISVANQKGGVGNGKKKIMESPSLNVLAAWHRYPEGLSIIQEDHVPSALSQSNKSESLCHTGISGSGVGLG